MSRSRRAFQGTITSFFQYFVFILLQAFLAPLVLKMAGQEVLGLFSILMQIIGYGILLDLGLSTALGRYLAQAHGRTDSGRRFSEILSIGRLFSVATNVLFAAAICLVALRVHKIVAADATIIAQARLALWLYALWMIARIPFSMYGHGLTASQNIAVVNLIATGGNAFRLLASIGMVYVGFGLVGLILANILAEALTLLIQRWVFRSKFPHYYITWKIRDGSLVREILSFGLKFWGAQFAFVLILGSDSILVGWLYGAAVAAVYYTTKVPAFLLFQVIHKLSDSVAPAVNELYAQGMDEALRSAYLKVLRYSLLLALPLALGVVAFNEGFITAWVGKAQYAGSLMTLALGVFIVTQVLNHVNLTFVVAVGDLKHWTLLAVLAGIASLGASLLLGKNFGMQWVLVGMALMDLPKTLFLFRRGLHGLKIPLTRLWSESLRPALLAWLPLCALIAYLKVDTHFESVARLIVFAVSYTLLWLFAGWALGLSGPEKNLMIEKARYFRS